jgi:DNA-directed RNA polymerase specialized sigma24 family protein
MNSDLEKVLDQYMPLILKLCGSYSKKYHIDYWDLYGEACVKFVEFYKAYTSKPLDDQYERGVDFPFYISHKLRYALFNYVRKERELNKRVFTSHNLDWNSSTDTVEIEDAIIDRLLIEEMLDYLKQEDERKYLMLSAYLGNGCSVDEELASFFDLSTQKFNEEINKIFTELREKFDDQY